MSDVTRKANAAKILMEDVTFKEVLKQLQDSAIGVFARGSSSQEQIIAAHQDIRAAETIVGVLEAWIADKAFDDKREERSAPS